MSKITELREGRGREKRVQVFLDGSPVFSLQADVAAQEDLHVGQELTSQQIAQLTDADRLQRCLNASTHYLGYRPRSESELRLRLRRRGFDNKSIEAVLLKLKEQEYLDDVAFARFWKDDRNTFSPRSQRLIQRELRQKGVNEEIIEQVVTTIDEDESAYRAASNRYRRGIITDYQQFRRHLGNYLLRRGFSYEVINRTMERLWQEYTNNSGKISPKSNNCP